MAQEIKVVQSLEDSNGVFCADIFRRPDGSFGFLLCRRDPEDGRGWSVIGGDGGRSFAEFGAALRAARAQAPWLE